MSNYRVRQVLAACKQRKHGEAEKDLLVGLATWLDDDSVEVRLSNNALAEASSLHPDTVKDAKRELRKKGWLEYVPATRPGELTLYRLAILEGGVTLAPPSEGVAGVTPPKGGSEDAPRGGQGAPEGGVGKTANLQECDHKLNPQAQPRAKSSARQVRDAVHAAVPDATDDEIEAYAEQINGKWHPDNLARYIRSFPAFAVAEAIAGMRLGSRPQPADIPVQDLCRCGQLHGGGEACLELAPAPVLQVAPESTPEPAGSEGAPCAYSGCRIRGKPVDPATRLHEACTVFAGIADGGRRSPAAAAKAS